MDACEICLTLKGPRLPVGVLLELECAARESLAASWWSCMTYDPWGDEYRECLFDSRVRGGRTETSGLGDAKLWRWPGRGVHAMFGRKPEPL